MNIHDFTYLHVETKLATHCGDYLKPKKPLSVGLPYLKSRGPAFEEWSHGFVK
jgi:hypothetical protein